VCGVGAGRVGEVIGRAQNVTHACAIRRSKLVSRELRGFNDALELAGDAKRSELGGQDVCSLVNVERCG